MSKRMFIYLTVFLFGVFVLPSAPADPDFGWHYKYGEYLFNSKTILKENVYSFTLPDYSWANSYWVSQLVIFVLYSWGGALGVSITLSGLLVFSYMLIFMKGNKNHLISSTLTLVAIFLYLHFILASVRPLLFSSIYIAFLTYVLLYKKTWEKFLPIMFLVWANSHADFTIGLFIYALYTLNNIYKKPTILLRTIKLPLVSLLVTLINPYGIDLWVTLLKEVHPHALGVISEMTPLGTSNTVSFWFTSTILAGTIFSAWYFRKKFPFWYIAALIFLFPFAIRIQYFIRPFLIIGLFALTYALNTASTHLKNFFQKNQYYKNLVIGMRVLLLVLFLESFVAFLQIANISTNINAWSSKYNYPYSAVQFVKENNLKGKMYNNYTWGGYLIWQLPQHKTFIDGRMANWKGKESFLFADFVAASENADSLNLLLEKHSIDWVFVNKDDEEVNFLRENEDWKIAYEDDLAIIFVQQSP